ncbi:MAG: hypothetical protein GQ559_09665 [Desulfobulbaceae bacterium]|nr:hypothetical protein [Desulfobulbaceae bacterium]
MKNNTLGPIIQSEAESSVTGELTRMENRRGSRAEKQSLQGALLVASVEQGEVLAIVGDRNPRYEGFNHALDMLRPVGSLIKPAVYLTALSRPEFYNLLTMFNDADVLPQSLP